MGRNNFPSRLRSIFDSKYTRNETEFRVVRRVEGLSSWRDPDEYTSIRVEVKIGHKRADAGYIATHWNLT